MGCSRRGVAEETARREAALPLVGVDGAVDLLDRRRIRLGGLGRRSTTSAVRRCARVRISNLSAAARTRVVCLFSPYYILNSNNTSALCIPFCVMCVAGHAGEV